MATDSKIIKNQFTIQQIAVTPCDSVFLALLPEVGVLKRPYDATEGTRKTNEYGEVVMTHTDAPIVLGDVPMRISPVRQRGELGFKVRMQGGEVYTTVRIFVCANIDVRENDVIHVGTREYQVLLVDDFFDATKLHHKELWSRRVDNL